jgi:hypothetical protein
MSTKGNTAIEGLSLAAVPAEDPGEYDGDREADNHEHNKCDHDPVREPQRLKRNLANLQQNESNHRISCDYRINPASFQLGR